VELLGLSCTKEELLEALQTAAQAHGVRLIILIDALNESEGSLWHNRLSGMLTTLSKYSWVTIALSVRSSYEDIRALIPRTQQIGASHSLRVRWDRIFRDQSFSQGFVYDGMEPK
jgi:hypothetical protein